MAWLYQRHDSKRWWIGYRANGQQILKSTKTTDKVIAEQELAKVELMLRAQQSGILSTELFQQISGRAMTITTLKASLESWLNEARGSTGPRTVEKYEAISKALIQHFHATDKGPLLSDVSREQIQELIDAKRAATSAATGNMSRKCLAVFFRRCKNNRLIRDNPMDGIKLFKASRNEQRVRRPFTLAELSTIYSKAPDDFWRYMILGGFLTGLRLGDLVTMPIGAVDLKGGRINLLTRKTGTPMHIPIAAPLLALLKKLKAERKEAKPIDLFWPEHARIYEESGGSWFSQRFYDLMLVKAGLVAVRPHREGTKARSDKRRVNDVSFHCFRHSYVSTLAALGQNQQIVKALAGHSSDEVNDLYTKVPPEVLKGAVALLPDITKQIKEVK